MAALLASSIGPPLSSTAFFPRGAFAFAGAFGAGDFGAVAFEGGVPEAGLADADFAPVLTASAFAVFVAFASFAEGFVVAFAAGAFAAGAFVVFVVFVVFSFGSSGPADGRFVRVPVLVATLNSSLRQPPWPAL
jgi:hypothetical protein